MPRFIKRRTSPLLVFALVSAIYLADGLEFLEFKLMDARFSLLQQLLPGEATDNIVLVEIDTKSLKEWNRWPWPRSLHAFLIERLSEAGVRDIVFDLIFSSPLTEEGDLRLEQALAASEGKVALAALREIERGRGSGPRAVATVPLERFRRHAELVSINVHPEADGLVRRMATAYPTEEGDMATMSAHLTGQGHFGFTEFWIDYGIPAETIPRISYADVLAGRFDPAHLAGKRVLVGATALELNDRLQVPIMRVVESPVLQILASQTLGRGALQRLAEFPVLAATLIVILALGHRFDGWSWKRGLVVVAGVSGCAFLTTLLIQDQARILVDTLPLMFGLAFSYAAAMIGCLDQQSLRLMLQSMDIRRRDAMMRNVVENSFDGIITMNARGHIQLINPAVERLFGYGADEMVGRSVNMLLAGDSSPEAEQDNFRLLKTIKDPREMEGQHKSGRKFPMEIAVSVMETDGYRHFTAIVRNISERKKQEALRHQALHDALTDLPNRTLLYDRVAHGIRTAKRESRSLALLLLDLDRFKEINDTLGHHVGDLMLQEVAARLRQQVRESDTVARLGGDEFAILLSQVKDLDTVRQLSEKILKALAEPFDRQGLTLEVSASIGIAMFPDHARQAAELIQRADVAMYAAKHAMSGHAVYDAEKDHNSVRHLTLSGELRRAIETGQLAVHYQPKIDLARNRICGVEALVRWHHPEHGFMPPDEFIPVAENTGMIGPLTLWVLHDALAHCRQWHGQGLEIGVAVNLSARQLQDHNLPRIICRMIAQAGVAARYLTLEVTESAIMADPAHAMQVIMGVHTQGVKLAIDDFGTGYSSLAYLRDLPADELKIDKSFVGDMTENDNNRKIVQSTINLAHNLGLKVVAEGVESEAASQTLAAMGCDVGQGYHFSHPLAPKEFELWLAKSPWSANIRCDRDKRVDDQAAKSTWQTSPPSPKDGTADVLPFPGRRVRKLSHNLP